MNRQIRYSRRPIANVCKHYIQKDNGECCRTIYTKNQRHLNKFRGDHYQTARRKKKQNIVHVRHVDNVLVKLEGAGMTIDKNKVDVAKDGDMRVQCPINDCGAQVFKLSRHLKNYSLNNEIYAFASKIAHLCAHNDFNSCQDTTMLKSSKPVCETEYAKSNYKYCQLCNGLILNLCDHLKSTHKLSKNSKDYINCMSKTVLIPACFVIKQGRSRSIMSVDDITDFEKNNTIGKLTNQKKYIHVIRPKLNNSRITNNESKVQDESVPSTSKSAYGATNWHSGDLPIRIT